MANPTDKYAAYTNTVLELPGVPDARIDLRRPIGPHERAALREVGLDRPFGVMTAENPQGENDEDAPSPEQESAREIDNDRRLAAFLSELGRYGLPFVRVDGVAPDGSYRERCVAVLTERDDAIALARRLCQLALFWFDDERFWLLPAEAGAPPVPLPAETVASAPQDSPGV